MNTILACRDLSCNRPQWNETRSSRVASVSAGFTSGELCGFCGEDGSGKGLLLNVLGLLEPPDSGTITLWGRAIERADSEDGRKLRNETFGYVFDHPGLLPAFSVVENVAMPLFRICGLEPAEARKRTMAALEFCGIAEREMTLGGRLTPEERATTAFARALAHRPQILVVISPRCSAPLLPLGRKAASELGLCVLWAGAETEIAPFAHRIVRLDQGRVQADVRP